MSRLASLLLVLAASPATGGEGASPAADAPPAAFDHVVVISVDGLRGDALVALPPAELPGFARLRRGASTLNARTDPDWTVTLPNHASMLTGRPVEGAGGHGWTANGEPALGATLHANRGAYVAGAFDVAHDRGLRTALFAGKTKFSLFDASWDAANGAPDRVPPDHGRDKLDLYARLETAGEVTDRLLASLGEGGRSLSLAHYPGPDLAAHAHGWDVSRGSRYLAAVAAVDRELVRLLDALAADARLRGRVAVILTADHGGAAPFKSHTEAHMAVNYTIPFVAWTGADHGGLDLYELNAGLRRDPSIHRPSLADAGPPPIRNGDAANLALALLGLPPVPGSTFGAAQDLRVR